MTIKIYNYYTREEITPIAIYGNVPFFLDTGKGEINVYLDGQEKKYKYWTYSDEVRDVLKVYLKAYRGEI